MRDYLLVIAVTLFLAWMIPHTRIGTSTSLATRNKNLLCEFLIFAILTLFIGLRTRYNDTFVYMIAYSHSTVFPEFWETFNSTLGDNPGFMILRAWLKTRNVSTHGFILFFTAVSIACSVYFLLRYSDEPMLALFLFFTTNAYTLSAAAVKQSAAIALGLLAVVFALKKKWLFFVVFLALAATFHPYVLLYALVPFLTFKPWSKWTYIMLAGFVAAGFMLENLMGTIVDITSMIGDTYEEEDLIGEGINVFRVLVANVPLILTFIYRRSIFRNSTTTEHVMINLAVLNGAIMFVGLFGTSIYFSRMASYFTIFQCISLPWIISKLPQQRRAFFTGAMIAGYAGFFVYANMISQSFDSNFNRITLWQYLSEYVFK